MSVVQVEQKHSQSVLSIMGYFLMANNVLLNMGHGDFGPCIVLFAKMWHEYTIFGTKILIHSFAFYDNIYHKCREISAL